MQSETQKLSTELQLSQLNANVQKLMGVMPLLEQIAHGSGELKDHVIDEITKFALSIRASKLDKTQLNTFFDHPYHLYKDKHDNQNSWHMAVPSFIDGQFGWLEKIEKGFNIFVVNPYADWLGDVPEALKKKLGMKDPLDVYLDGEYLRGKDLDKIRPKLKMFIKKDEKDRILIDKTKHWELLVTLIKENILPFVVKPIDKKYFLDQDKLKPEFELFDYHLEPWETFKKYSNIGYFLPPSGGKTYFSIYAAAKIKGPHLVTVPSRILQEQWIDRIETYTTLKVSDKIQDGFDIIVVTYQAAIKNAHKFLWQILFIDEAHHLPANMFSKMATIPRNFTIGLTATPQREDGREEYIFALLGKPCGLSWLKMKELGVISTPDLNVWIVKDEKERMLKVDQILQYPTNGQTIIFSDLIKMGSECAKKFGLKHVHGNSKIRLKDVKNEDIFVASRVADEGVSLHVTRVIEISWLHGSRRQELQRFTRILHGKEGGLGHIIMTLSEYASDRKRLYGVMEKGFKIILHREGYSEKEIIKVTNEPRQIKKRNLNLKNNGSFEDKPKIKANDFEINHPILSMPGIQKKLKDLNQSERLSIRVIYGDEKREWSKEEVWNRVGIGRIKDFANFEKLQQLKLIVKIPKKRLYKAA